MRRRRRGRASWLAARASSRPPSSESIVAPVRKKALAGVDDAAKWGTEGARRSGGAPIEPDMERDHKQGKRVDQHMQKDPTYRARTAHHPMDHVRSYSEGMIGCVMRMGGS
jgi:hypothetical protein